MLQIREDVRELPFWMTVHLLWARKWRIALSGAVLGTLALLLALVMTPMYKAEIVVVPAAGGGEGMDVLSKLGGGLGDLASIAGIASPQSGAEKEALGTLRSQALVSRFITDNNLMPILFSGRWDAARHAWKPSRFGHTPTLWRATQMFDKGIRTIVEDKVRGTITLTVEWKRPGLAAAWANGLIDMANAELQARTIDEAQRDIAYLNEELTKTNNVELQQSIYQIMEQQIKIAMVARGRKEFAFRVVDPAVAPEKPVSPKTAIMVAISILIGLLVASVSVIRSGFAPTRRE